MLTTAQQFISTVYTLVINGRWAELADYLALLRDILSRPAAVIIAGTPRDKEIK